MPAAPCSSRTVFVTSEGGAPHANRKRAGMQAWPHKQRTPACCPPHALCCTDFLSHKARRPPRSGAGWSGLLSFSHPWWAWAFMHCSCKLGQCCCCCCCCCNMLRGAPFGEAWVECCLRGGGLCGNSCMVAGLRVVAEGCRADSVECSVQCWLHLRTGERLRPNEAGCRLDRAHCCAGKGQGACLAGLAGQQARKLRRCARWQALARWSLLWGCCQAPGWPMRRCSTSAGLLQPGDQRRRPDSPCRRGTTALVLCTMQDVRRAERAAGSPWG